MRRRFPALCLLVVIVFMGAFAEAAVRVGAAVQAALGFPSLQGKRVGVVTNHTALVDGQHLADLLVKAGVRVVGLYAPEHGIRGTAEDGVRIGTSVDSLTGATVHSLYGETKKPSPAMLAGVDLLVFDIQDVGVRFYTYISTMGLAMQAAAEAGIPFVVFDRPNPLGGDYVAGYVLEPKEGSFVGMFPIPVAHGMTVGELAQMIKGEKMLPRLDRLDLRIIRMEGWQRRMRWPETGLSWVPTSPNIAEFEAALLYPGMCFLEATSANEGRGTDRPFRLAGAPGIDPAKAAAMLNGAALPGVVFEPCTYRPTARPGISSHPKYRDQIIPGIRILVTDPAVVLPVETGVHVLSVLNELLPPGKPREGFVRKTGMRQLAGTARLADSLTKLPPRAITAEWEKDVTLFRQLRARYLLY